MKRQPITPTPPPTRIVNSSVDCSKINEKNIRRWKMVNKVIALINLDRSVHG